MGSAPENWSSGSFISSTQSAFNNEDEGLQYLPNHTLSSRSHLW